MREARFYQREGEVVRCLLCPRKCRLRPGAVGVCRGRKNVDGTLYVVNYGKYTSIALDPIEKKPLYHFYPGSWVLSLGTLGCNLMCRFCQNWEISQGNAETFPITPEEVVELALKQEGCRGIAYTYSEPLIWYEFILDTARLARFQGLKNVVVTNGEINQDPLGDLLPYVDAFNIDLKSIRDDFYRKVCSGELEPVKETIKTAKRQSHVEVTNLIIPTLNDSVEELEELTDWVATEVGVDTPLHFSRYFPRYKLSLPPTPVETLRRAKEIGDRKLRYVYVGNVGGGFGEDTHCYSCGATVIEREGFEVVEINLEGDRCRNCGARIEVVGVRG